MRIETKDEKYKFYILASFLVKNISINDNNIFVKTIISSEKITQLKKVIFSNI